MFRTTKQGSPEEISKGRPRALPGASGQGHMEGSLFSQPLLPKAHPGPPWVELSFRESPPCGWCPLNSWATVASLGDCPPPAETSCLPTVRPGTHQPQDDVDEQHGGDATKGLPLQDGAPGAEAVALRYVLRLFHHIQVARRGSHPGNRGVPRSDTGSLGKTREPAEVLGEVHRVPGASSELMEAEGLP